MRRILALAGSILAVAVLGIAAPASAATPSVRFLRVQYDSPGSDDRSRASLNAEWISLINSGPAAVDLFGWTVHDESGHRYRFGHVRLAGRGGALYLHTGTGRTRLPHVYWNSGAYIWNNTGDTAHLRRPTRAIADTCAWTGSAGRARVAC